MKDTMIQWHPGFVAAMNLELAENRDEWISDGTDTAIKPEAGKRVCRFHIGSKCKGK